MTIRLSKERGFTLIELMITVAIVAILAAIAYPSYTKYVQRGYRSEGLAMLNDAVARTERFYAQNNTYAGATLKTIGLVGDDKITVLNSTNAKYQLTFATASSSATTYTLQIAPQGTQTSDPCGTMSIDQAGTKTSTGGTDCFK